MTKEEEEVCRESSFPEGTRTAIWRVVKKKEKKKSRKSFRPSSRPFKCVSNMAS